jgi:hypothetical protein
LATRSFRNLERRVIQLQNRFVPTLSPTGYYNDRQYDFVRAYIVLTHAEMEEYLEGRARDIIGSSLLRWKNKRRVNRCIASLLLHHDKSHTPKPQDSTTHIHCAVRGHENSVINQNHGIKEENLFDLFVPLGLDKSEVSANLLIDLTNFGSARGQVAHTSARKVQTPPDPQTFLFQVGSIMKELAAFDSTTREMMTR